MAAIREDHATGDAREAHVMRDAEVHNASAIIISRKLTQSRRAAADQPYLCRILVRVVGNLHASEAQCIAGTRASEEFLRNPHHERSRAFLSEIVH